MSDLNFAGKYDFPTPIHIQAHFDRFNQTRIFADHRAARKHSRRWHRKLEDDIRSHQALAYIFAFTELQKGDQRTYFLSISRLITFTTQISTIEETGEVLFQANFAITNHPESD